jgi:hypothetical protein
VLAFVVYAASGWQRVALWRIIWVLLVVLFALFRRASRRQDGHGFR